METTLKTIIVGARHLKLRDLLTDPIVLNLPLVVLIIKIAKKYVKMTFATPIASIKVASFDLH